METITYQQLLRLVAALVEEQKTVEEIIEKAKF